MPPPAALRAAQAMRRGLERARRGSTLPLVALLEQAVGLVEVHATTAFVELGLPDAMAGGPRPATTIAADIGADADAVERLLAFLATRGIVRRRGDLWALTAVGDLLRADHPDSVRDWIRFLGSDWQLRAWEHLADGIRTPSTTPFQFTHGTPYFDHLAREPEHGELFDDAMRSRPDCRATCSPAHSTWTVSARCATSAAVPAPSCCVYSSVTPTCVADSSSCPR